MAGGPGARPDHAAGIGLLLGDHHLDDPGGSGTLFRVPGDQRLPEGGGGRDVDRVGAPKAELAGEDSAR